MKIVPCFLEVENSFVFSVAIFHNEVLVINIGQCISLPTKNSFLSNTLSVPINVSPTKLYRGLARLQLSFREAGESREEGMA